MDVGDQPPFEARAQALLQPAERLGRSVAGEDDLAIILMQVVEGMEELFLGALLVDDELHIVDEQDVHGAIARPELIRRAVADGVDQLIGKRLG